MKLEERLHEAFASEQADVGAPDTAQLRALGQRRRARRNRRGMSVAAVAVAFVVAAGLVAINLDRDGRDNVLTGPVPEPATTSSLPPGRQTGPIPAPNARQVLEGEASPQAPTRWFNARTGYNDRQLVVSFIGSELPIAGQDNACATYYTGLIESLADRVIVGVVALQPPGGYHDDIFCTAVGYGRTTTIELDEPLAGRAVYDAADPSTPQPVTDGATLAYPTFVPDGYKLESESFGFRNGSGYWGQTYTKGEPMPWRTDADIAASGIPLLRTAQVRVADGEDPVLTLGNAGVFSGGEFSAISGRTTVHGQPAEVRTQTGTLGTALVIIWQENGSWFGVSSLPNDPRNATLTLDELQQVAESMHAG